MSNRKAYTGTGRIKWSSLVLVGGRVLLGEGFEVSETHSSPFHVSFSLLSLSLPPSLLLSFPPLLPLLLIDENNECSTAAQVLCLPAGYHAPHGDGHGLIL